MLFLLRCFRPVDVASAEKLALSDAAVAVAEAAAFVAREAALALAAGDAAAVVVGMTMASGSYSDRGMRARSRAA